MQLSPPVPPTLIVFTQPGHVRGVWVLNSAAFRASSEKAEKETKLRVYGPWDAPSSPPAGFMGSVSAVTRSERTAHRSPVSLPTESTNAVRMYHKS